MMDRYERRELGRMLSEVDVVVVPAIWYENAPLVIGEMEERYRALLRKAA